MKTATSSPPVKVPWDADQSAEIRSLCHSNYPTVESRIEDKATLHGPECRNYSSRRSGASFITGRKAYVDETAARKVNAHKASLAEKLAAIPHHKENAPRIAKLRAKLAKLEIMAGNVEHRRLEPWESTVADHHKEHHTHKTSGTGKKALGTQFFSAQGNRRNMRHTVWSGAAPTEHLPNAPLEIHLDSDGQLTVSITAPPAPPTAKPVEGFLERTKRIARSAPRVKKEKRVTTGDCYAEAEADILTYRRRYAQYGLGWMALAVVPVWMALPAR